VQHLFDQRRFSEANQVVHKFLNQESTLVLAGLGKKAAEALLAKEPATPEARQHIMDLANSLVKNSSDYRDYLWLGRIRWVLGQHKEARQALDLALEKGEKAPETWVTLVSFLADTKPKGWKDEIAKLIQRAQETLPKEAVPTALAACHEILGELKETEKYLKEALTARPNDLLVRHNLANFYLHHENQAKDAKKHLQFILKSGKAPDSEMLWARRSLAIVVAAEKVTPAAVNFMATRGRGLICLSLTEDRIRQLNLPLMVHDNTSPYQTAFTVSIEASRGISTGISAADRATTISKLVDPATTPADLVRPGHVFPLRYAEGGVLRRAGHTEAAIDLARLAGLPEAGVLAEVVNDDGTMARLPELREFANTHDLARISIGQLIEHRRRNERQLSRQAQTRIPNAYGQWQAFGILVWA